MKTSITIFTLLLIFLSTLLSCEDDFCAEPTTPQLIIRLKDSLNINDTKSLPVFVWNPTLGDTIIGIGGIAQNLDSIVLPLNTAGETTIYRISTSNEVEEIEITYETEDIFVSRGCGFKSIFKNVNIEATNDVWIKNTQLTTNTIENEDEAHFNIFH